MQVPYPVLLAPPVKAGKVRCTLSGKRAVSHDWPREIFEILVNKSFSSNAMVEYSDNDVATTLTDCVRGLLIHPFLLPANEHLEVCRKKNRCPEKARSC